MTSPVRSDESNLEWQVHLISTGPLGCDKSISVVASPVSHGKCRNFWSCTTGCLRRIWEAPTKSLEIDTGKDGRVYGHVRVWGCVWDCTVWEIGMWECLGAKMFGVSVQCEKVWACKQALPNGQIVYTEKMKTYIKLWVESAFIISFVVHLVISCSS